MITERERERERERGEVISVKTECIRHNSHLFDIATDALIVNL